MLAPVDDGRIVFPAVPTAADESLLDRPERHQHRDHKNRGEDGDRVIAEPHPHAHWCGDPDRCGGGEPVYVVTRPQDRSGAEEADPGDDLGGDAGRIHILSENGKQSHRSEHARANRDETHRLDPGRVTSNLSFGPEKETEDESDDKAET